MTVIRSFPLLVCLIASTAVFAEADQTPCINLQPNKVNVIPEAAVEHALLCTPGQQITGQSFHQFPDGKYEINRVPPFDRVLLKVEPGTTGFAFTVKTAAQSYDVFVPSVDKR